MASISICTVCAKPETKYKCSKCKVPSCSLTCYKQHQSVCSAPTQVVAATFAPEQPVAELSSGSTSSVPQREVEALFKQYPQLQSQLQQIYRTSQTGQPDDLDSRKDDRNQAAGRAGKNGFELGLRSLSEALNQNSSNSQGLQAFIKLISKKDKPK